MLLTSVCANALGVYIGTNESLDVGQARSLEQGNSEPCCVGAGSELEVRICVAEGNEVGVVNDAGAEAGGGVGLGERFALRGGQGAAVGVSEKGGVSNWKSETIQVDARQVQSRPGVRLGKYITLANHLGQRQHGRHVDVRQTRHQCVAACHQAFRTRNLEVLKPDEIVGSIGVATDQSH